MATTKKTTKANSLAGALLGAAPPKPTHRSVSRDRAKELGKERLGPFYVGIWVGVAMDECVGKARDKSRNALLERLVRAEAKRLKVEVPEPEEEK